MIDVQEYGPWAVIAGGSEGVGAEFALHLARAGFDLVLIARKPEPLAAVAERAGEHGARVRVVRADLLDPGALETIAAATDDLDVGLFLYNAGSNTYRSEFVESDPAGVQRVLDLNITAPLALLRHFGLRLKRRGRGGILVTGSNGGFVWHAGIGAYASAKAFLRVFVEGLWLELKPFGVDVLELSLGLTRTPAMARLGVPFDLPGLRASDPAAVAAEGLAHLKDGPSWIADGHYEEIRRKAGFPRADVVRENFEEYRPMMNAASKD